MAHLTTEEEVKRVAWTEHNHEYLQQDHKQPAMYSCRSDFRYLQLQARQKEESELEVIWVIW